MPLILTGILAVSHLGGCGKTEESVTIRVGAMSGPTAMGMVKLMSDSEAGLTENTYEFADLATDATAMVTPIATGELDIAAVPSNLASNIYAKTEGGVEVLAVNALGVLNLVERGETISGIADLAGKTVYATGQGAVPEYTIRYLLTQAGLDADSDLEIIWCADTTEALSYVSTVDGAIAILPQPFVTVACSKVEDLRIVLDLNEAWNEVSPDAGICTGVIVVRREFAEKYPEQVKKFLEEYEASVAYTQTNTDEAAELIANYGIVGAAGVAKNALPGCHIVCLTGDEMKTNLSAFLQVLYDQNPASVGGSLPGDDFYYAD